MKLINKKNVFWNSFSFILISLLGFINFTLYIKTYNSIVLGYFLLLSAYWSIGSGIDLGFGVSTIKNISESLKLKDFERINKIVNTFLVVYCFIGCIIALVVYAVFYFYNYSNGSFDGLGFDFNILLFLFAISFFARYIASFLVTVYEGLSEFILISKINLTVTLLNTIMTIFIFIFNLSLYYLVLSQVVYGVLYLVVLVFIIYYKIDIVAFKLRLIDLSLLKQLGLYNLNIQVSFILTSFIDPIIKSILSYSLGLQYVTFFETAKKIMNLSNGLINSALKGLLNKISEANAVGELKKFVNENIYVYSNLALDYSILAYGILNPFICIFILLWFKNYESMNMFLLFLLPYTLINTGGPLYSILMVEGKGGRMVVLQLINVISVALLLFVTVLILNNYLGLLGFYFATILNSFLMIYFLKKYIGFDFHGFIKQIEYSKLIKLNLILILQVVIYYIFPMYLYYLSGIFVALNILLFYKQISYYGNRFIGKFQNMLSDRFN